MQRIALTGCQATNSNHMRNLVFFIALFFCACNKSSEGDANTIPYQGCREIAKGNDKLKLCYEELLEDSRCPEKSMCIWQGVAKARFTFHINGQQHTIHLSTMNLPPSYRNDTTVGGYKLTLTDIKPYPGGMGLALAMVDITP